MRNFAAEATACSADNDGITRPLHHSCSSGRSVQLRGHRRRDLYAPRRPHG